MNFMVPSRKPTTPSYSNASCTNGSATRSLGVGAPGRLMEMAAHLGSATATVRAFTHAPPQDSPTSEFQPPPVWPPTPHPGPAGHTGNQTNVKLWCVELYAPER